jgi:hypothetical protein
VSVAGSGALALSALAMAAPAGASTLHPTAVVGASTSQFLAGYSLRGNGGDRFRDLRATITVPAETPSSALAGTVGDGIVQATSVNGGIGNGIAPVFDASGSTCNSNQWTLEYAADQPVGATMPILPSALSPLLDGGADVCLGGGAPSSEYVEIFYSTSSHFAHFQAGPSSTNQDVLADVPDGGYHNFYSGGWGTDTTTGTAAAALTTGSVVLVSNAQTTQYNGHKKNISQLNLEQWVGTETGGAPSVSNPVTLSPTGVSLLGTFAVNTP